MTRPRHRGAEAFEPVAVRVDRRLREVAPERYAGTLDGEKTITVFLVPPLEESQRDGLLGEIEILVGPSRSIRTIPVSWSIRDLEVALERLVAAMNECPELKLSGWGLDIGANRVMVGYLGDGTVMAGVVHRLGYDERIVRVKQEPGLTTAF